mmetsp:Transcript_28597/g.84228  ORF Transcript_28597/g.84228 Transcript_28597/m.84228 type:complete len:365 (-) Transcript_28597:129-1223(-)
MVRRGSAVRAALGEERGREPDGRRGEGGGLDARGERTGLVVGRRRRRRKRGRRRQRSDGVRGDDRGRRRGSFAGVDRPVVDRGAVGIRANGRLSIPGGIRRVGTGLRRRGVPPGRGRLCSPQPVPSGPGQGGRRGAGPVPRPGAGARPRLLGPEGRPASAVAEEHLPGGRGRRRHTSPPARVPRLLGRAGRPPPQRRPDRPEGGSEQPRRKGMGEIHRRGDTARERQRPGRHHLSAVGRAGTKEGLPGGRGEAWCDTDESPQPPRCDEDGVAVPGVEVLRESEQGAGEGGEGAHRLDRPIDCTRGGDLAAPCLGGMAGARTQLCEISRPIRVRSVFVPLMHLVLYFGRLPLESTCRTHKVAAIA